MARDLPWGAGCQQLRAGALAQEADDVGSHPDSTTEVLCDWPAASPFCLSFPVYKMEVVTVGLSPKAVGKMW